MQLNKKGYKTLKTQLEKKLGSKFYPETLEKKPGSKFYPEILYAWAEEVERKLGEGQTIENSIELQINQKPIFFSFDSDDFYPVDIEEEEEM